MKNHLITLLLIFGTWAGVGMTRAAAPGSVIVWGYDGTENSVPLAAQSGVVAVSCGEYLNAALKADGSVVVWGLAASDFGLTNVPLAAQSGVMAIAASDGHVLALRTNGSVVAWGENLFGESTVPLEAQSGIMAIAAGLWFSVALKTNGGVIAWGYNLQGETTVPVAAQSGVVAIAVVEYGFLVLKADGTVPSWDDGHVPGPGESGVAAIALGRHQSVSLKTNGSVVVWGGGSFCCGQTNVPDAAQSGVTAISSGDNFVVALKSDGTVVAWGDNSNGEITGTPTQEPSYTVASPVTLNGQILSGVTAIAAGAYHTLAIVTPTAPAISLQPTSQTIVAGNDVSFSVAATGYPLNYQWRFNGADIPGATLATLTLTNISIQQAGGYSVIVSNQVGTVTSEAAILTVSPAPIIEVLHSFQGSDGAFPLAGLVQARDGHFYGTTSTGGACNKGTVFWMTAAGTLTTLVSFDGTNGAYPRAALVQGSTGHLYGTTVSGGIADDGTVFQVTPNGVLTTLVSFQGTNGQWPFGKLALGSDGYFYGTTYFGGAAHLGTVFQVATNGTLATLASFDDSNGRVPVAGLVQASDGYFYGSTYAGGGVFRVTTNGTLILLVSFDGNTGGNPTGELIEGNPGNFFGTTYNGGPNGGHGTVFRLATNGALTTLVQFNGNNGAFPWAGLARGSDGNFYGTTVGDNDDDVFLNDGTVFQMTPDGALTTLVRFNGTNGHNPYGALVQGSDGYFYGTTEGGGEFGMGTVFRVRLPVTLQAQPGGNQIILSWPTNFAVGFTLQSTLNLNPPVTWSEVTNPPAVLGGQFTVTNTLSGSARFYRLRTP